MTEVLSVRMAEVLSVLMAEVVASPSLQFQIKISFKDHLGVSDNSPLSLILS
jgi:hypothetical protein